jgi:hypothetical protein
MRRIKVRIANPINHGSNYTSYDNASRFVGRGDAEWISDSLIRFVNEERDRAKSIEADRAIHRVMADAKQMRRVPIIQPWKLLLKSARKTRTA